MDVLDTQGSSNTLGLQKEMNLNLKAIILTFESRF